MTNEICGNCNTAIKIEKEFVDFGNGKVAYIRCSECNNSARIAWDKVKHLEDNSTLPIIKIKEIECEHKAVSPKPVIEIPKKEDVSTKPVIEAHKRETVEPVIEIPKKDVVLAKLVPNPDIEELRKE